VHELPALRDRPLDVRLTQAEIVFRLGNEIALPVVSGMSRLNPSAG
jgi:hypothetical protein